MTSQEPQAASIDPSGVFRGSTVMITGHTGFKGSWLATWLDLLGARVIGISDRVPDQGAFRDLEVESFVETHFADVRDHAAVSAVVETARPDVVFHLAAQPLVRASWKDPATTFATNVLGTVNTVEASLACPSVQAVVVATTDKVYENAGGCTPFTEGDRLGGHDPYSASKAAAELALVPYRDAVHMGVAPRPLVSVRAGNVIGGGDWSQDRLLPDIVRALVSSAPVVLRYPDAIRPWQHVLDCLWGYLLVSAAMVQGIQVADAYNFAPSDGDRSVLDVARLAVDAWGAERDVIVIDRDDSAAEAPSLRLDAGLARRSLGWAATWSVDRSVEEAIRFYRADDPATLGRMQIAEYTEPYS